jgi:hypothetical protein
LKEKSCPVRAGKRAFLSVAVETIKKLESYHRDFFLVFAHVEAPSGLWAELEGGRLAELGQNEFFRRRTLASRRSRRTTSSKRRTNPVGPKRSSI